MSWSFLSLKNFFLFSLILIFFSFYSNLSYVSNSPILNSLNFNSLI